MHSWFYNTTKFHMISIATFILNQITFNENDIFDNFFGFGKFQYFRDGKKVVCLVLPDSQELFK